MASSTSRDELAIPYPESFQLLYSPVALEMSLSPDPYVNTYPRSAAHDGFPATITMGFDSNGGTFDFVDAPYMFPNNSNRCSPNTCNPDDDRRLPSSTLSTASANSSIMGSPMSAHGQLGPSSDWALIQGLGVSIVDHADLYVTSSGADYSFQPPINGYGTGFDYVPPAGKSPFVDPALIHPELPCMALPYEYQPPNSAYPASPALSTRTGADSPFVQHGFSHYPAYPVPVEGPRRKPSLSSFHSGINEHVYNSSDEGRERQRCPQPDCGKSFKDLKAHMLTHQTERPEKCPIASCEYHTKGFARKYDKNRHTLTHYKGTMVCGFCPGSGSASEKSFNRADVFKRHLTAVHGVEQTPPNARKRAQTSAGSLVSVTKKLSTYAPDATGKCSTCSQTFANAQDFYEHLDDCVLRIVQQEDPAAAVNAAHLAEVANDDDVADTLERNKVSTTSVASDADMVDDADDGDYRDPAAGMAKAASPMTTRRSGRNNPVNGVQKSRGLTHSRNGVRLHTNKTRATKSRNRNEHLPSSWGYPQEKMNLKKRVACAFDGPRRLYKDDMLLPPDAGVRIQLPRNKRYVTDLDMNTLKRAEGFFSASDEEKGPWVSDDPTKQQMLQMLHEYQ